jgi:opacity protein-like surface antigen
MTNILTTMVGVTALTLSATIGAIAPASAKDATGLPGVGYGAVDLGFAPQETDFDKRSDGVLYGVRYGRAFSWYRVDAELFDVETTGKTSIGNIELTGLKINGYVDYHNGTNFVPYFTVGAGVGDFDGAGVQKSDQGLGALYSVGVGTRYFVTDNTSLDFRLQRVWSPTDVRADNYKFEDYEQDLVTVGVNFAL